MGKDLLFFLLLLMIFAGAYLGKTSVIGPAIFLVVFAGAVVVRELRKQKRLEFVNQLKSYRHELRNGGTVVIDNLLLRYESVVSSYYLSIGILFTSVNIPSLYRPVRGETPLEAITYSLSTLLTGWWSITGPFHTIPIILGNIHGGKKISVAMLIDEPLITKEQAPETPCTKKPLANQTQTMGKSLKTLINSEKVEKNNQRG